jgi:endonuclease III
MKKEHIEPFFATLKAANPQPNTELEYTSVFELLAAVLLSAQATDVGVNKATRKLFPVANTPQKILALGLEGLETYIKTIGLFRSKAKHLMQTCQMLVDLHGGEVPRNREALEALPGVGRKTANVVLNVALVKPPWRWTRIFFAWATAQAWRLAPRPMRLKWVYSNAFRLPIWSTPTIG